VLGHWDRYCVENWLNCCHFRMMTVTMIIMMMMMIDDDDDDNDNDDVNIHH